MGDIIGELIKKWGIKKILELLANQLRKSETRRDRRLADDLEEAIKRYDRDGKNDNAIL